MSGPSQIERLRVAWIDTDAGGRIHFTAAFRWAEAAETALSRRLGLLEHLANLPRRAVSAEYLAVLQFDDELEIELTVEHVGTTSITYVWEVRRDAEACIRGTHTIVHIDDEGRPAPVPETMRQAFASVT